MKMRVGVLASGNGSNVSALLQAAEDPEYPAKIVVLATNNPHAGAIKRAGNLPVIVLNHRYFASREAHEQALDLRLAEFDLDLLVLAGYMRILSPWFVKRWRIINLHPADTRAYQGPDGYGWALKEKLSETWVTVHEVDEGLDTGLIIAQSRVPIHDDDTIDSLRRRGQAVEHQLLPRALAQVCRTLETVR